MSRFRFLTFALALSFAFTAAPAAARDLVKIPAIGFREFPEKDIVILEADAPATFHEVKSPQNVIIDITGAEYSGKDNVKLVLGKTVKLVRAVNMKGKDNIARFMIVMNGKFPVTTYKENNHVIVEIDKSSLAEREADRAEKAKRYSDARSDNPLVDYHYNQGRTFARLGKWSDAIDEYLKALQIDPHNEKIKVSLNVAKDNIKSEREVDKAIAQYNNGEYNEAIRSFRAIVSMWPDDISSHFHLAKSYLKLNKYREAMIELERVLQINPDYENAKELYELAKRRKILNSFSVDVKDQDVIEVLRSLLHGTGFNLIVEDGIKGKKATANFSDFTLEQALNEIVTKNGLKYERDENVIKVMPDMVDTKDKVYSQANLVDLELQNVLEVIAKMMEKNFIFDASLEKSLKKKITFFIKDELTIGEIFDLVLKTNELVGVPYSDNTFIIMTREQALKKNHYVKKNFHVIPVSNVKPSELKTKIFENPAVKDMMDDKAVVANDASMNLSIFESDENVNLIRDMVKKLDLKQRQVTIAVKMLEVSKTAKKKLGLQLTSPDPETFSETTLNASSPLLFRVKKLGKVSTLNLDAQIEMLENDDYVRTLSSPIVRVVDGEEANIHSGKSIPVRDVVQNPQYEGGKVVGYTSQETWTAVDIGITLKVKPTLHHDGDITLQINVKQDDADLTNVQTGSHFVTTGKEQTTKLRIRDGETVVMGGLINTQRGENHIRLPFFSKIPVVGRFFKNETDNKLRSELILFLTAFLVNKDDVEVVKESKKIDSAIRGEAF